MVELEQVVELVGVFLVGLELIDELDLAVEERLVAAGQVDEDVADALAEQGALLLGHLDRHVLDRVEGVGQLADLVLRAGCRSG